MTGNQQNIAPVWKKLMKNVDLDEPTSFLDQRECKPNEIFAKECTKMFESRISAGATEKLPGWEKPHPPTVWKDMLKNASNDTVNQKTRRWSNCTKFQVLAWMIINSNRKNLNQSVNYHKLCSHFVLKCCAWHELEHHTFCGRSTNLQEQSQHGLRHVTDD